jgi:hypothetical protein
MVNDTNNNDNINNAQVGEKWTYSWGSGDKTFYRNAEIIEVPTGDNVKIRKDDGSEVELKITKFSWKKKPPQSPLQGGRSKTRKNKKKLKKRKNKSRKYLRKSYRRK